jgi:hypothetical protein
MPLLDGRAWRVAWAPSAGSLGSRPSACSQPSFATASTCTGPPRETRIPSSRHRVARHHTANARRHGHRLRRKTSSGRGTTRSSARTLTPPGGAAVAACTPDRPRAAESAARPMQTAVSPEDGKSGALRWKEASREELHRRAGWTIRDSSATAGIDDCTAEVSGRAPPRSPCFSRSSKAGTRASVADTLATHLDTPARAAVGSPSDPQAEGRVQSRP